jgi:hypothetical protein
MEPIPSPSKNWRAAKPDRDLGLAVWFLVAAQLQPNHQPPIPDVGALPIQHCPDGCTIGLDECGLAHSSCG